jgi:hypothetical protein
MPTCANCDCHRRQAQHKHAIAHLNQAGTDPSALTGAGNPGCSAKIRR